MWKPAAAVCLLVACSATPSPVASPSPTASTTSPTPAPTTPSASPTPSRTPDPGPAWPRVARGPAPPALGAVVTLRVAARSDGGTLAAGLLLPRVGGSPASPLVLTPCGRRTSLRGADVRAVAAGSGGALPKTAADITVLLDPGHGGAARGAAGAPGSPPEKVRNLEVAREVRRALAGRVGRVYLTRDRDLDAVLTFRTTLADALRADVAVSVHFNGEPDGPLSRPGVETYASVADPYGRRLAGVMYAAQRRFLDTVGGPWVGDRDAGAKYRLGRDGRDFYALLRRGHVPWVISESLFISQPREAQLLAGPGFRVGLGAAIAEGIVSFTTSRAPGSGWTRPYPRPASDVGGRGNAPACVDPAR